MTGNGRPQVIIRNCETYDVPAIRAIIRDGLRQMQLHPHGRTLLKPNLVSSGELFEHAYTRAEFTEGVLLALRDENNGGMTELAVGERSGITMPTRLIFKGAGYDTMVKRLGVKHYYFDEEQQISIRQGSFDVHVRRSEVLTLRFSHTTMVYGILP
ncbi:MAG: DUF362 domain-containing protein [Dehalococcoidales bacterium]